MPAENNNQQNMTHLPADNTLSRITELFKLLGDNTRARILYLLFESEMRVTDIALTLDMSQSSISHQLKQLKEAKLVRNRRAGKEIFYSLADSHIITIFKQVDAHVHEEGSI